MKRFSILEGFKNLEVSEMGLETYFLERDSCGFLCVDGENPWHAHGYDSVIMVLCHWYSCIVSLYVKLMAFV